MNRIQGSRYLLRFDDLCPTMNWAMWAQIEAVLVQCRLKPLVAIVPDNHDPALQVDSPAEDFWDRARAWQDRGWTIALHGYQHRYVSRNAGIVATRKKSEFAGLPAAEQREKLQLGVEIFEREGIRSRVWIAPGDTFDAVTVALLAEFGIRVISAGHFRFPYVDSQGMTWVPQQLYYFRPAPAGVWTVCYHHNGWSPARMATFREDVNRHRANLASLEDIVAGGPPGGGRASRWLCMHPRCSRFLIRAELKLWSWRRAGQKRLPAGEASPSTAPEIKRV